MATRSLVTGIVFVVLALCCLPFVLFGVNAETVGGGVTWIILLLGVSAIFFLRASVQAKRERADAELIEDLLPNEMHRRGEP